MSIEQIGSGVANAKITAGTRVFTNGEEIPLAVLQRMPAANRNALIENRKISVFPKHVEVRSKGGKRQAAADAASAGTIHVFAKAFGKYTVLQGTILAEGLGREEAQALAEVETAKLQPAKNNEPGASAEPSGDASDDKKPRRKAKSKRRSAKRGTRRAKKAGTSRAKAPPKPEPGAEDQQPNGPIET
jgi:hypothetical protein